MKKETFSPERPDGMIPVTVPASADGLQLAVLTAVPAEGIEHAGILQLVHGMCEHKERYIPFMQFMASKGWICVIHDHRGHGGSVKSEDDLGDCYDGGYMAAIQDVKIVSDWIRGQYPDLKFCMLGHSMGSMIVRSYAKSYDDELDRLIVCGSPSWDPASRLGSSLTRLIISVKGGKSRPKLVQKMSFNSFNKNFKAEGSPNAWVCSDPEVVAAYDKDPLCSFQFTANGFHNLFGLMQYTYSNSGWKLANPGLPVHFISGAEDPCLKNEKKFNAAVAFMRKVGYRQVSSHLYPGMRHEILNETGKQQVWNDVLDFLK